MKKIKNSFAGLFVGFFLFIAGIILLFWNEGNNVKNIKDVKELRDTVIEVTDGKVHAENEGKLIATSGELKVLDDALVDNSFGVEVNTLKLVRYVEMYQWKEESDTDDDGDRYYTYKKEWSNIKVDSSRFDQASSHRNPTFWEYESSNYYAKNATVGEFTLSGDQIESAFANESLSEFDEEALPEGYIVKGKYITNAANIENPEVGNIRISYTYVKTDKMSLLAVQRDNSFVAYRTNKGTYINFVRLGVESADEMIGSYENAQNTLTWVLRFIGFILILIGALAFFGPISQIASFVPILGNIVGFTVFIVCFLIAVAVSLADIAVAWIFYRPVVGILLLLGVVVILILTGKVAKSKKKTKGEEQSLETPKTFSNAKYCSQCGTQNPENSQFCANCGNRI